MQVEFPNVKVYFTLDRPPSGWRQGSGFVTEEMMKASYVWLSADQGAALMWAFSLRLYFVAHAAGRILSLTVHEHYCEG
jgi:hypothetical protein